MRRWIKIARPPLDIRVLRNTATVLLLGVLLVEGPRPDAGLLLGKALQLAKQASPV